MGIWYILSIELVSVRNINKRIKNSIKAFIKNLIRKFLRYLAWLFHTSEEKIKQVFGYICAIIFLGFLIYGLYDWLKTSRLQTISKQLSYYNTKISQSFGSNDLVEVIDRLKPFLSLIWNIFIGLALVFFCIGIGTSLFEKLQNICEKNRYGDFYKTYIRGLKTTGYFLLLFLPFVIWIFMWIIGNTLDSVIFSYKEWSQYSNQYYTYHHNWIMLILGFGSIPLLIALYFPIVKGLKRHLRENKGKKLLLDEIEDLKNENEELKERIKFLNSESIKLNE